MNPARFLASLLLLAPLAGVSQAVTFNLAGDWLAEADGVRGIPNGSLIMLIASTRDGTFDPPSGSGLIDPASDDVILGTFFAHDDNGRSNRGSYAASVQVNFGDEAQGLEHFDSGDPLLLRWFPTLGRKDLSRKLGGTIPYGEFRSDATLLGSNAAWITPGSNSAIVNLSVVADTAGNLYDPEGGIASADLAAFRLFERVVWETAAAQLSISTLAGGGVALSWPLLEGSDPVGLLQESVDLLEWTAASAEIGLTGDGHASAVLPAADGPVRFYRIARGE